MLQSLPSAGGVFPTPDVRTVKKPNVMAIRAMAPMTSQTTANNVTGSRTVEKKQNDKKIEPSATATQESPLAQPQNQQLTSDFATDTNRSHVARSQSQRLARTERAERAQERIDEATIRELRKRDASVRKHEQAHARVGGARAGTPQYEYTTGPDGKRYITGGYVALNARPKTQHPKDKLEAAELTARAALAPVDP